MGLEYLQRKCLRFCVLSTLVNPFAELHLHSDVPVRDESLGANGKRLLSIVDRFYRKPRLYTEPEPEISVPVTTGASGPPPMTGYSKTMATFTILLGSTTVWGLLQLH